MLPFEGYRSSHGSIDLKTDAHITTPCRIHWIKENNEEIRSYIMVCLASRHVSSQFHQ
jgi:hypothetical protein